jgi:PAS domain-containing protein
MRSTGATLHPQLERQLRRAGIEPGAPASAEALAALLEGVNRSYADAECDRDILERAVDLSSRELRQVNSNLTRQRDRLEARLAAVADGLCVLDAAGRVQFVNPAGERLLGWSSAQLLGREFAAAVAGTPGALEELRAAVGGHCTCECDDAQVHYSFRPVIDGGSDETVVLFRRIA